MSRLLFAVGFAALLALPRAGHAQAPAGDKATEDQLFGAGPADAGTPAVDAGTAPAADQKKTEDEMFGSGAPAVPATPSAAASAGPGVEELNPIDINALISKTNDNDNKLAIGGMAYLMTQYDQRTIGTPLLAKNDLESPDFMDLYLDARPNDRLRFYFRGRLNYIASLENSTSGTSTEESLLTASNGLASGTVNSSCSPGVFCPQLDQLWIKFDAFHKVFFTVGRQRIKWGAGRFWNPTDFLNPVKLNPLAVVDQRLGVDLVKIQVPVEPLGMNFYAIAQVQDTGTPVEVGVAGRAEVVIKQTEITMSASWRQMAPFKLGADVSTGIGPFDLHAEAALLHPDGTNEVVTYNGTLGPGFYNPGAGLTSVADGANPQTVFSFPTLDNHIAQWIPQVVAGGEVAIPYNDKNNLLLGAEYFFNDAGYSNTNVYPLLFLTGLFQPLYTGRHYAAVYASLPTPGHLTNTNFTLSEIGNLSDKSFITRFDYNVTVLTRLEFFAFAEASYGNTGELHYGLNIPGGTNFTVPSGVTLPQGITAAELQALAASGLQIGAPLFTIGAGLIVTI